MDMDMSNNCNNNHFDEAPGQNKLMQEANELNDQLIAAKTRKDQNAKTTAAIKILRTFISANNYQSAESFVTSFQGLPESATNNEWAHWYYYLGRLEAIKGTGLDTYKKALKNFELALRKAPQNGAVGFKQEVNKWIVLVKLLVGEIPERSLYRVKELEQVLHPYLRLTQAVRLGDVDSYLKTKAEFNKRFLEDNTLTLVERIHQSVIRTAIRQISLTYSRIFINEVKVKLQSPTNEDAHDTVMKAINEGILRAQIVTNDPAFPNQPYVKFGETDDQYRGTEPQREFNNRINELLDVHNHAVKALRYPDNRNPEVETIEEQLKREQEAYELAAAEEDDDDDFLP